MQRKLTNPQIGEPPPAEVLQRSRIARLLYARRRGAHGVSFEELCAAGGAPVRTEGQLRALEAALARLGSQWQVETQEREDEDGMAHRYHWLTAPWCPRGEPYRAALADPDDPELISLDELAAEEEGR